MLTLTRQFISKVNRPLSVKAEIALTALAVASAFYVACPSAFASTDKGGGGPGNGGDAVKVAGKWTLLDLAEAGITQSKVFDENRAAYAKHKPVFGDSLIRAMVDHSFADKRFSLEFREALTAMLEFAWQDGGSLIPVMNLYQWQLTDLPLAQIGDERSTLDLKKLEMVQLAVRRDSRIQIYSPVFLKMNVLNQVALVLHEISYALAIPQKDQDGTLYQPSWQARSFVANYLSSGNWHPYMTQVAYEKGRYVFEGSNTVYQIGSFGSFGFASDDETETRYRSVPKVVVCSKNNFRDDITLAPMPIAGRKNPYQFLMDRAGSLPGGTRCTVLQALEPYGSLSPQDKLAALQNETRSYCHMNMVTSSFSDTKTSPIYTEMYAVANEVYWRLAEFQTKDGPAFRAVVREQAANSAPIWSGSRNSDSFQSVDDCKSGLAKTAQSIQREINQSVTEVYSYFSKYNKRKD